MSEQNLSPKVTPTLLDRMYNNFAKITDWVIKGKESQHPMPKALAWLFATTETNANQVAELTQLVTTLQQTAAQKNGEIEQLKQALANVNTTLAGVVDAFNGQQPTVAPRHAVQAPVAQVQPQVQVVVATPAPQPEPAPVIELADLDDVVDTPATATQAVSPNEQAIQVSAAAVGAGQLDPASYSALDAEINSLLG